MKTETGAAISKPQKSARRTPINWNPMLFNEVMMLANIEGRKSESRRLNGDDLKALNTKIHQDWTITVIEPTDHEAGVDGKQAKRQYIASFGDETINLTSPYGEVGEVLYARERLYQSESTGLWHYFCDKRLVLMDEQGNIEYKSWKADREQNYCPSILMPFFACRYFSVITDVRLERLHAIDQEGAMREGIENVDSQIVSGLKLWRNYYSDNAEGFYTPVASYKSLWDSINGRHSWHKNVFVWVYTYSRIEKPPITF